MSATRKSLLSLVPTDAHFAGYASAVVGSHRRSAVGATAQLLLDPRNQIYVSAATIWEMAIKHRKHPHIMPIAPDVLMDACVGSGFHWLDVSVHHAKATAQLPLLHADPFDRMLAAQSMQEPMVLLTRDQQSAISNQQSAISNQQSAISKSKRIPNWCDWSDGAL